jgi:hypothetical protein
MAVGDFASNRLSATSPANRVDWVFGLAPNAVLSRQVAALEKSTAERFKAAPTHGKRRRFTQFYDAAQSWSRAERIIARVEADARPERPGSLEKRSTLSCIRHHSPRSGETAA